VAIDMRGYGDSDKPEGLEAYQIDQLTEDIKQLVLALGKYNVDFFFCFECKQT
jgi:epoxide hydrolase 4